MNGLAWILALSANLAPALSEDWTVDTVQLRVVGTTARTVTIEWYAPWARNDSEDQTATRSSSYDLRYSLDVPITDATWDAATRVPGVPAPVGADSEQFMTVTGLAPARATWFALRATYEGAISAVSPTRADTREAITMTLAAVGPEFVMLQVAAPVPPSAHGRMGAYDLRYSTLGPILSEDDFAAATPVDGEPGPETPGTIQGLDAYGLLPETVHHFALKCSTFAGVWGDFSNSLTVETTAPSAESHGPVGDPAPKGSGGGVCAARPGGSGIALLVLLLGLMAGTR